MITHHQADLNDVPLLAEWNAALIQDEGHRNPMTVSELAERMTGWLQSDYTAIIFEDSGQPVAYALYRQDSDSIYIRHFFVTRQHRCRGIGRLAIKQLLNDILPPYTRVILEVLVNNDAGRKFWSALGFSEYSVSMETYT